MRIFRVQLKTETMKTTETIRTTAAWKTQYELMFTTASRRQRRTRSQVETMKQKAKLYVALFGTI